MNPIKTVFFAVSLLGFSCHCLADDKDKLAVANQMIDAWDKRNWQAVYDLFSEDAKMQSMMFDPIVGKDAIQAHFTELVAGVEKIKLEVRNIGVINDVVVVERVDDFVFNGKRTRVPVVGMMETADGKVTEWRDYYDRATLVAGLVGPEGAAAATHGKAGDGSDDVLGVIKKLQKDWNNGDMQAYLDAYWSDEKLILMFYGTVLEGKQAMTNLFTSNWPTEEAMGDFRTENERVVMLSENTANVSGDFEHQFTKELVKGGFSHVLKRFDDGVWRIVNEHTSRKKMH